MWADLKVFEMAVWRAGLKVPVVVDLTAEVLDVGSVENWGKNSVGCLVDDLVYYSDKELL